MFTTINLLMENAKLISMAKAGDKVQFSWLSA